MKILVAHPGKQHSYRLASALNKYGMLDCYITTIYNKNTFLDRIISFFLSPDNKKRLNARKTKDINDKDVIQFCRIRGLVETFLYRIDKKHKLYEKYRMRTANIFGKKVAKLAIKRRVDAVVMYDSNATKCFDYLKKKAPNIICVMDVSIAVRPYMKYIYEQEIRRSGNNDLFDENAAFWNRKELREYKKEITLTDYFLVPSDFVRKSLLWCGIESSKIFLLPYGTNIPCVCSREKTNDSVLSIIFVGRVNYRKGISYLFQAVEEIGADNLNLSVVGAYDPKNKWVQRYINKPGFNFVGSVTFDKMKDLYAGSDIFVIDSFAEGMAQVGIEAMACGLPIICSSNSGVNDLVAEGENGFVIEPGNVDALKEKLIWFINNRNLIPEMSEKARVVGKKFSWDYYEKNCIKTISQIINNFQIDVDK